MKYQFGSTPGDRCQDGTFIIKTLSHLGKNPNLTTRVELSNPLKPLDTSNHALVIYILVKYGTPPRIFSTIKHIYNNSITQLIIRNMETSMYSNVDIKQGYSMAPFLFLFLMMDFAKTLEDERDNLGLSKLKFARKDNSPGSSR